MRVRAAIGVGLVVLGWMLLWTATGTGDQGVGWIANNTNAPVTGLLIVFREPASVAVAGTPFAKCVVFCDGRVHALSDGEVGQTGWLSLSYAPASAGLLGYRWTPTPEAPANRLPLKVLHVSRVMMDEVQRGVSGAGVSSLLCVTQVSLSAFNAGMPERLDEHDVVLFGINDGYEPDGEEFSAARLSELRDYVQNGGGVVWTHDSLEWYHDLGPVAEEPAGVDYDKEAYESGRLHAIGGAAIAFDHPFHPLFDFPFSIPRPSSGEGFAVDPTHTTGGRVTTATALARFVGQDRSRSNFYLTAHDFGRGRVVVNEIGHSYKPRSSESLWPALPEWQLLVNSILWAGGI